MRNELKKEMPLQYNVPFSKNKISEKWKKKKQFIPLFKKVYS
jgi:hypothetical protein